MNETTQPLKTDEQSEVSLSSKLYRLLGFEKRKLERIREEKAREDKIKLEELERKMVRKFAQIGDKIKYLGQEMTVVGYTDYRIVGMYEIKEVAGLWVEWFNNIGEHQRKFLNYYRLSLCEKQAV